MLQAIFTTGVKTIEVSGLTQWDKGRTLTVTCAELPKNFEAHFSFKGSDIAWVVKATAANGVSSAIPIPNIITRQNRDAVCWIYVTNGTMEKTTKTVELPIKPRQKPADYIYEEDDILTFEKMIAYTETVIERAETAESNTKTSETNAKESEESAKDALAGIRAIVAGNEAYTKYESDRKYSGAIICEASGTEVVVTDSADAPLIDFTLSGKAEQVETTGKNLLPFNYKNSSSTLSGTTFTVNSDGSITVSGTATDYNGVTVLDNVDISIFPQLFTVAMLGTFSNIVFQLTLRDSNGTSLLDVSSATNKTVNLEQYPNATNVKLTVKRDSNIAVSGTVYPMIVEGDIAPTEYEPYTGGAPSPSPDYPQEIVNVGKYNPETGKYEVEVTAHSAQLFDVSRIPTTSIGGATVTNNGDGSFTISGDGNITKDFAVRYLLSDSEVMQLLKSGLLHVNYSTVVHPYPLVWICKKNGEFIEGISRSLAKDISNYLEDGLKFYFGFYCATGKEIIEGTIKPMFYQDGDGTWESFNMHTEFLELDEPLRATKDGHERDSIRISGKVDRNTIHYLFTGEETAWNLSGNYIGSAFIRFGDIFEANAYLANNYLEKVLCTHAVVEGDFSRYEYGKACVDGGSISFWFKDSEWTDVSEVQEFFRTQYENGTPVEFIMHSEHKTTETLPESEIAKLKRLQTFNPTTIIAADGGEMEIEYVADTKIYIDNKFKELEQALANTNAQLL